MTIGSILNAEPRSSTVFRKYGLEYLKCLALEFGEACQQNSVDPHTVKLELINLNGTSTQLPAFDCLLDIILRQHRLVKIKIQSIREALLTATQHESLHLHELLSIQVKFDVLIESLEIHLYKEEMILFPEFVKLWARQLQPRDDPGPFRLKYPLERLESEHESTKAILAEIRELSQYHQMPAKTNKHYGKVCLKLDDFEKSLIKLIELEDRALFPEALMLEKIFTVD